MTPAKLYIARLSLFSPILGKQENGENKGKMDDYHACHDATNGMMIGIGIMMGGAGGSMVKIKPLHCMQGLWMVGLCLGG